jgi:hypothetical protein
MSHQPPALFPTQPHSSHANRGLPFEQALAWQLRRYEGDKWLVIRQQPRHQILKGRVAEVIERRDLPTAYRLIDGLVAKIISKGPPDWILMRGPTSLLIDAKSSVADRWPLSEVADHQAEAFDRATQARVIAGVVAQIRGVVWWLPWSTLGPLWHRWAKGGAKRGQASLGDVELETYGVRCEGFDFLGVAIG